MSYIFPPLAAIFFATTLLFVNEGAKHWKENKRLKRRLAYMQMRDSLPKFCKTFFGVDLAKKGADKSVVTFSGQRCGAKRAIKIPKHMGVDIVVDYTKVPGEWALVHSGPNKSEVTMVFGPVEVGEGGGGAGGESPRTIRRKVKKSTRPPEMIRSLIRAKRLHLDVQSKEADKIQIEISELMSELKQAESFRGRDFDHD